MNFYSKNRELFFDNKQSDCTTIESLKAENQRLRQALESIAKNTCCDKCQEAALVAQTALQDVPNESN